jgi:hypothetical protein
VGRGERESRRETGRKDTVMIYMPRQNLFLTESVKPPGIETMISLILNKINLDNAKLVILISP